MSRRLSHRAQAHLAGLRRLNSHFRCGQLSAEAPASSLGLFQSHADIGTVPHAGSAQYDAMHHTYTLTGSGENMWFSSDAFHFAWKQVSGDTALTAEIAFPEKGGNAHRKAVLMIRQNLEPDSPYADVALHGEGLTSLQYRDARGPYHARDRIKCLRASTPAY